MKAAEIAQLSQYLSQQRISWRNWLDKNTSQPDLLAPVSSEFHLQINELWKEVGAWFKNMKTLSTPQLVEQMMAKSGVLHYALNSDEKSWNLEVLQYFLDFVSAENEKNPFMLPLELLETLDFMEKNGIELSLVKRIGEGKGVQLTTLHSSKGLEYERVYILGAIMENWKERPNANPYKIRSLFANNTKSNEISEEDRRLFYVGMTRAKRKLFISYYTKNFKNAEVSPVKFVQELIDENKIAHVKVALPSEKLEITLEWKLKNVGKPVITKENEDWLREKLQDFTITSTAVTDYIKCGLRFYYNHLIRIPRAGNEYTAYGNAMHHTVNQWLRQAIDQGNWLTTSELIGLFERNMYNLRNEFNKVSYHQRLEQGKYILPLYKEARERYFKDKPVVTLEKSMLATVNNIPIKGRIDKLEFSDKNVRIVDYKTGKFKKVLDKLKPPGVRGSRPGDYWFQLAFYHLLIIHDHEKRGWNPVSGVIDLMEHNDNGKFLMEELEFTSQDLDYVIHDIEMAHSGIMNLEFLKGCGRADCHYCSMSERIGLSVLVPEESIEESEEEIMEN